jgi:hypothetical protein
MTLNDYKSCFLLRYDEFIARYNIHPENIIENVSYEKITDATRVNMTGNRFFIFRDSKLQLIYISNEMLVKEIWTEFKNDQKAILPEETVRSRAGKTSNQLIFATQGITVSTHGSEVDFIELYPACSVEDYLKNIYHEPKPFIR